MSAASTTPRVPSWLTPVRVVVGGLMACFVGYDFVGFEAMRTDSCMGRC